MYNKKVLSTAKKELTKAKAPAKPKDIITDPMGQWKYPGLPTRIPSNDITMKGVGYPVLGVANNGQRKIMLPGADYTFPGADYVDEYPQMRKGGAKKKKTKSLSGTNKLMLTHPLLQNYKNKVYDPNVDYFQEGGISSLEGDLISKVIMERNKDKDFVQRAYALGKNPGTSMFNAFDPDEFGQTMSHKMAWGEDDNGQAYMFPTVMNPKNEAIRVPNQYADYISNEGYKRATGMIPEESFQDGGIKKQKSKKSTAQQTLDVFDKTFPYIPHFEKQDPDSFLENAIEVGDFTGITSWDDVSRSAIEHGWESPETALEIAGAIPFVGKIGKAGKAGGRLIKTTSNMFAKTARQKRNAKAAANLLHYGTKGIQRLGQLDNIYDAYNTLKQDGGYIEAELTDDEIEEYRKGGYIVEDISVPELNQAQTGGFKPIPLPLDKTKSETTQMVSLPARQAIQHVKNKPAADKALKKEKKEQQKFKEELWKKYKKLPLSEKISDRVGAFINDPLGMTSRALLGEQAYIPGMAQGLHDYENPEVREKYLKELGYTPGEFDASDIQNIINPGNWVTSITENTRKGNIGAAALDAGLMFLPHLHKGTISGSNIRSGANMLKNDLKQLERNPQSWFQTPEERLNNPELYKSLGKSSWKDPLGKLYDFNDTRKIQQALRRESKLLNPVRGNAEKVALVRSELGDESFANVLHTVSKNKAARKLRRSNLPIAPIRYPQGNILGGGEGNIYVNQLNPEEIVKIGIKPGTKENMEALVRIGNEMREAGVEGLENVALPRKVIPLNEDPMRRVTSGVEFQPWLGNKLNPENPIYTQFVGFRGEGSLDAKNKLVNIVRELDNRGVGIDYPHNNIMYDKASDSYKLVDFNHINESSPAFHWNKTDMPIEQRLKSEGYLSDSEANIFDIINNKSNVYQEGGVVTELSDDEIQDYIAQGYTIEEVDEPELIEAQKGIISTKEYTDKKGNKTIKVRKEDGTVYTKVIGKDGKVYNRTFDPKKDSWATDQTKNLYSKAQGAGNSDWFWAPAALTAITGAPLLKSGATAIGEGIVAGGDAVANATLNQLGKSSLAQVAKEGTKAFFNNTPKWITKVAPNLAPGMNLNNLLTASGITYGVGDYFDKDSDVRKSYSKVAKDPTLQNLGEAASETGLNMLDFIGLGLGNKALSAPKYLKKLGKINKLKSNKVLDDVIDISRSNETIPALAKTNTEYRFGMHPDNPYRQKNVRTYSKEEAELLEKNLPENLKTEKVDNWAYVPEELRTREAQTKAFNEATEVNDRWVYTDPKKFKELEDIKNQLKAQTEYTAEEYQDLSKLNFLKSPLISEFFKKNNSMSLQDYYTKKFAPSSSEELAEVNKIEKELEEFIYKNLESNPVFKKLQPKIENLEKQKDLIKDEIKKIALQQDALIDPLFKSKVNNILHETNNPSRLTSLDYSGVTEVPFMRDPKLVHVDEQSMMDLPDYDKDYIKDYYDKIGGVNTLNNTITLASKPGSTIYYKKLPEKKAKLLEPKTWLNAFKKNNIEDLDDQELIKYIEQRMIDPKIIGQVNIHELGHDNQKYKDWLRGLADMDPTTGYLTKKGNSKLGKEFEEALVEPTKLEKPDDAYSTQSWQASVNELHSDLQIARLKAVKSYMKKYDLSVADAVSLVKNLEHQGSDELYDFYISVNDVNQHFKNTTSDKVKRKLLKVFPVVGATALSIGALNKKEEKSPRRFKEGGIVAELSDDEIQDYINQGYIVEEIDEPEMQVGGESDLDSQIEAYKQKLELIKSRRTQNPIQETVVETPVKVVAVPSSNSTVQQVVVKQPVVKKIVKPKKENPIVKTFEKSKIKQEVRVKTEDTKQKLEKFTKDTLAKIKNQTTPIAVPEPSIVNMYKKNYQKHLNSIITDPSKSKNLFNNNQLEKEIMDRQYLDNVRYGRFDKRGDDVMNRTDFKRNVDSEKYLADIAEDNSVIIDIGSALGNNDPKLSGVSVFELASNPKIKQKNIHVIATDIASGVKDFKTHVKNKTAYDIDYAEVPMNFKTPISKILKDKKLSDKENIYLRTANSIDLLMNVDQAKEHLNHIAKSLKDKTVTYLYNNVILYKPKGKTTFQKLGNINNAGYDHNNKSWLINKNRTPYKLTKAPLR